MRGRARILLPAVLLVIASALPASLLEQLGARLVPAAWTDLPELRISSERREAPLPLRAYAQASVGGEAAEGEPDNEAIAALAINESRAELAVRVGDYATAAEIYARIAGQALTPERRQRAMMNLAEVYRLTDDPLRVISVLERYQKAFPDDVAIPGILLRLGFLYRETGAPQRAVDAFFGVLKKSFSLSAEHLAEYREITDEASRQIAETYYRIHQYELAAEFFTRLLRTAPRDSTLRFELLTKCGYAYYFARDYRRVIQLLQLDEWTEVAADHQQAEARCLRAAAFWALQDPDSARAEVLNLAALEVEPNADPYWNFWWKYLGNELANDLFARRDYAMAHKLYYSLLHLSEESKWQLPIIFQIGRCREVAGAVDEARVIYDRLLARLETVDETVLESNLVVLRSRVEDQLKGLAWEETLSDARQAFAPPLFPARL